MPRTVPAPTVQNLLDRMNYAFETLDTLGCAVSDDRIEAGPHIGRAVITLTATLSEHLMALEAVLTKAGALEADAPTPYFGDFPLPKNAKAQQGKNQRSEGAA